MRASLTPPTAHKLHSDDLLSRAIFREREREGAAARVILIRRSLYWYVNCCCVSCTGISLAECAKRQGAETTTADEFIKRTHMHNGAAAAAEYFTLHRRRSFAFNNRQICICILPDQVERTTLTTSNEQYRRTKNWTRRIALH